MERKLYQVIIWEYFYRGCFTIVFFSFLTHLTIFITLRTTMYLGHTYLLIDKGCRFGWIISHEICSISHNNSKTVIFLLDKFLLKLLPDNQNRGINQQMHCLGLCIKSIFYRKSVWNIKCVTSWERFYQHCFMIIFAHFSPI